MNIPFYKYQGTGNDFILIDNRTTQYLSREDIDTVHFLCDRKFGIGADGLILLQNHPDYDFEMIYFNSDGREGSMCGNGGRCTVAFAKALGMIDEECRFLAVDGEHEAKITLCDWVELKMGTVKDIEKGGDYYYMDTGSPHYIVFVEELDVIDVVDLGRTIRYSDRFREKGTNVNFVEPVDKGIEVATYERGVEDETLSCGTGVTAAAIAWYLEKPSEDRKKVPIKVKGGQLEVHFHPDNQGFSDIWLCGPATSVFKGTIKVEKEQKHNT